MALLSNNLKFNQDWELYDLFFSLPTATKAQQRKSGLNWPLKQAPIQSPNNVAANCKPTRQVINLKKTDLLNFCINIIIFQEIQECCLLSWSNWSLYVINYNDKEEYLRPKALERLTFPRVAWWKYIDLFELGSLCTNKIASEWPASSRATH